jgi:dienelactone hydrolase
MSDEIGRREFLKRGTVAGVIATTGIPVSTALGAATHGAPTASDSSGTLRTPPDPHARELAARHMDSKEFCLSEYDAITPVLSFKAKTPAAARAWQSRARAKLIDRLGGFPATRSPLNAEVLETKDFGSYTREKIAFDTRHNLSTVGYLLLPKAATRPLPAIVVFSGHGRGLPDILGLDDEGNPRAERNVGYAKEYALQCAEHGYATFAVEQLAFGTRRDDAARKAGPAVESCRPAATSATLFGQTMAGWRVWDAMRAIDYLETRPEVNTKRVATLGASGGGTTSLLTGALDPRVKVTVVSAYFNTFRDSIVSISHCPDNYVPGLLRDMEMYDAAGLVAPRKLFCESGRNDRIFPIAGFQTAVSKAEVIYRAFGVPDSLGHQIHEGAHEFNGTGAFEFLKRSL